MTAAAQRLQVHRVVRASTREGHDVIHVETFDGAAGHARGLALEVFRANALPLEAVPPLLRCAAGGVVRPLDLARV
jgi:hypothetical protein